MSERYVFGRPPQPQLSKCTQNSWLTTAILYGMDFAVLAQRFCHIAIWRLLVIIGMVVAVLIVSQAFELPYWKTTPLSPASKGSTAMVARNATLPNNSPPTKPFVPNLGVENDTFASDSDKEAGYENEKKETDKQDDPASDDDKNPHKEVKFEKDYPKAGTNLTLNEVQNQDGILPLESQGLSTKDMGNFHADSRTSFIAENASSVSNAKQTMKTKPTDKKNKPPQEVSVTLNNKFTIVSISNPILKRLHKQPISISQMNSMLLNSSVRSRHMRPGWSSVRDRELVSAKLLIENSPLRRNISGLYASVFRNVSMFIRSYELMEHTLKIYTYREGERPIYHQPVLGGIYASEGWFMKLMEGNKKFAVRDPKKAHLFYLPFSSQMLRIELSAQNIQSKKDLEKYLKRYVELIAGKYRFWNRTHGADHFLVACHDWAPRVTTQLMGNCIRSLCNANVANGFKIGKDTTLPVTYIRSVEDPLKDMGGRPPSQRHILAFFAGGMHGYVRPILLQYWENKEPDMKIFGPMPRDIEGKKTYREYMKNSKYCICARGYEVHTPRVVEAIFYECVPVIISDNYVPPFFEVLNWEAFCVFIQEKDIPNLRKILLSIPEKKYLALQSRVKMVQRHFLWHKNPVRYDLFHMVLHSIWYNRLLQIKV